MTTDTIKYYKFINVQENGKISDFGNRVPTMKNRDFIYRMGLNEVKNFNDKPECTPDALYFSDLKNIHKFIEYGNTLFEVSCPSGPYGARIIQVEGDKYKTDQLVVEREVVDEQLLQDIYNKAIERGCSLRFVPNEYKTYENCLQAVHIKGNLGFVPDKYQTYELCLLAVQKNGSMIRYVLEEHRTPELCSCAGQGYTMQFIPKHTRHMFVPPKNV